MSTRPHLAAIKNTDDQNKTKAGFRIALVSGGEPNGIIVK